MTWSDTLLRISKDNDIRLIAYVLDDVLTPLVTGASTETGAVLIGKDKETHPSLRLFALGASPCCLARRARPAAAQAIDKPRN
jgi:hypothetical protein